MKAKYILLLAALALSFAACEKQEPFDTQSENDAPLILKPYNESGTGSFTYQLANPDTPLFDSVTVTPSRYTTVNWYLDSELIFTGTKINMCFPAGKYALTIEAVTTAGKRTTRTGTVNVTPYPSDPYSAAPEGGRHLVPEVEMSMEGSNMNIVAKLAVTRDIFGKQEVCSFAPSYKDANLLKFTLPATEDGAYYLHLLDAGGLSYGADQIHVHNSSVVLSGFETLVPNAEWTMTGAKLQDVASVKVDDITITTLTATASSVTLTAPDVAVGSHTLSMQNKDGSDVLFITAAGTVKEVETVVSSETTIWEGPVVIDWNADLVKINKSVMDDVPVGSTIFVYFEVVDAEYHAMRITTPWWGDDLVSQIDGMENVPSPYSFTYDDRCKGIVDMVGDWSIVGFGLQINKITFK